MKHALFALILLLPIVGCASSSGSAPAVAKPASKVQISTRTEEVRALAMSFADSYVTQSVQSLDELAAKTANPEIAAWTRQQKLSLATAAFSNAAAPSPHLAVVDLVILVSLRRAALENHWVPTLLHDEGAGVVAAARRAEQDAWQLATRVLTPGQVQELAQAIDHWRTHHPDQYYVGWGRLTDFAMSRKLSAESPEVKLPGSIFGLLYIDPLSNLDPVAQEMKNYRDVADRMLFLLVRLPLLLSGEVSLTLERAMKMPETRSFVGATTRFADATDRFVVEAAAWPDKWAEVATRQQGGIQAIVGDVRGTLAEAEASSQKINRETAGTISHAADSGVRVIWHAAAAGLLLLAGAVVAIPVAMVRYRRLLRREAAGQP